MSDPCRESQDPADFVGIDDHDIFLVATLDISGFPPANESDIYFVPADLSGCEDVLQPEDTCVALFQSNQAHPRVT